MEIFCKYFTLGFFVVTFVLLILLYVSHADAGQCFTNCTMSQGQTRCVTTCYP